jgi:hypothetical protein
VSLIKLAASVKVIVNMDKNIPASGGELPAVQLTFAPSPSDVLREAGGEVVARLGESRGEQGDAPAPSASLQADESHAAGDVPTSSETAATAFRDAGKRRSIRRTLQAPISSHE